MRVLSVLVLMSMLPSSAFAELVVPFSFYKPGDKAKILVKGEEHIESQGTRVEKRTSYSDANGKILQTEECRYDSQSLKLETYRFQDLVTGEMAEVKVEGLKAKVKYRETSKEDASDSEIEWGATSLSGKAIPELLRKHWDVLVSGGEIELDLYVPFRMSTIGFRVRRHEETLRQGEMKPVTFRLEPSNWVIRQFAPTIYFTFATEPKQRLIHYLGPSMVDIDGKKNQTVEIEFW